MHLQGQNDAPVDIIVLSPSRVDVVCNEEDIDENDLSPLQLPIEIAGNVAIHNHQLDNEDVIHGPAPKRLLKRNTVLTQSKWTKTMKYFKDNFLQNSCEYKRISSRAV